MWEMCTEKHPFPGMSPIQVAFKVSKEGHRPSFPESTSPALVAFIKKCWDQDPEKRPTFEEICNEFAKGKVFFEGTDMKQMELFSRFVEQELAAVHKLVPIASTEVRVKRRKGDRKDRDRSCDSGSNDQWVMEAQDILVNPDASEENITKLLKELKRKNHRASKLNAFIEGEMFEATEKIHGTQTRFIFTKGVVNDETFGENKDIYIASKGQGDKGLFFKNNLSNANSYYVRAFKLNDIENKVVNSELYKNSDMLTLFGETYGMQDLKYGLENGHIGYRLFDVYVGKPRYGRFLNYEECKAFASELGIERVPSLYVGEYSYEKVKELTDGKTTLGKNKNQIREGVVIRPLNERYISELGRVFLKSVSEAYKLRKGETTEYN